MPSFEDAHVVNAALWGVVGNLGTDQSVPMSQAADAASSRGGGIVLLPAGVILASSVPLSTGVTWQGQGAGATTIRLPAGSTSSVFVTDGFAGFTGTNTQNGCPLQFGIRDLSIDGNRGACPGAGPVVSLYGFDFALRDLNIFNGASHGLWLEFDVGGGQGFLNSAAGPESFIDNVKVVSCAGDGFHVAGTHDSMAVNCIAAFNGGTGFYCGGSAWNWISCHAYGGHTHAFWLSGTNQLVNCQGEGALVAQVYIDWWDVSIVGGHLFFPGSSTSVGLTWGPSGPRPQRNIVRGLRLTGFGAGSGAAIDFTNLGSNADIDAHIHQADGVAWAGVPPADASLDVKVGGGVTTPSLFQRSSLGRAAIASPTSDTVGTKAAIDAIRAALTGAGLTL